MGFLESLATGDKAVRQQLGRSVTYTPGTGSAVTVTGVFDAQYQLADVGMSGISASGPSVFLTIADLPSDPSVDTAFRVTVGAVTYRARETKPDGTGGVLIALMEA